MSKGISLKSKAIKKILKPQKKEESKDDVNKHVGIINLK